MSQVLEQEITQSDEYYQQEVRRMLAEMQRKNEIMKHDQEEIDYLKQRSRETLQRIDENLVRIEAVLL